LDKAKRLWDSYNEFFSAFPYVSCKKKSKNESCHRLTNRWSKQIFQTCNLCTSQCGGFVLLRFRPGTVHPSLATSTPQLPLKYQCWHRLHSRHILNKTVGSINCLMTPYTFVPARVTERRYPFRQQLLRQKKTRNATMSILFIMVIQIPQHADSFSHAQTHHQTNLSNSFFVLFLFSK
jgi:hypothetical protein